MDKYEIPDDISELEEAGITVRTLEGLTEETKDKIESLLSGSIVRMHNVLYELTDLVDKNIQLDDKLGMQGRDQLFSLHFHLGPLTVDLNAKVNTGQAKWEVMLEAIEADDEQEPE
jgi:hypothetical protein